MLFVEPLFFIFFAVVFGLYWLTHSLVIRKLLLTGASYLFYGAWDWRFLSLILISTAVDYFVAIKMQNSASLGKRKAWLAASLIVNLGMLGLFKYFNFFVEGAEDLLTLFGASINQTTLNIVLPVGISFYTFQTLSYSIDVYRGKLKAEKNPLDVALFVAFFPQLVAGPIVRAIDFLPQLHARKKWADVAVKSCLLLFAVGFFKKACVSDNLAYYVDLIFSSPENYAPIALATGVFLYAIQIYCDFSGYTDMAIATAGLLGFTLPKNFNAPYLATNIIDFWRRWHISLSTWLRDYLYISLGGNRHGELKRYRNLMITMVLGGLWHGAAWTFIFWGFLHGLALSLNHLLNRIWKVNIMPAMGIIATFLFTTYCWVFFRAPDFETGWNINNSILTWSSDGNSLLPFVLLPVIFVLSAIHIIWHTHGVFTKIENLSHRKFYFVLGAMAAVSLALQASGYKPFIYFQF